jgi:hypothetical protein
MTDDQHPHADNDRENQSPACDRCGAELDPKGGLCPECDESAPVWMVYLVYALVALFAIGLIYRLIFP